MVAAVYALILGCGTALYVPTALDAQKAGTTLNILNQGRSLYVKNCASCHSLYLPATHSAAEWVAVLNRMQPLAHINNEEKSLIINYLTLKSGK